MSRIVFSGSRDTILHQDMTIGNVPALIPPGKCTPLAPSKLVLGLDPLDAMHVGRTVTHLVHQVVVPDPLGVALGVAVDE